MKPNWKKVKIGDFLTERIGRYKPDDPKITALKRIEKINFNGEIYLADKSSRTDMIIVKDGDLIISGINVAKGAIAVYKGKDDVCATIHYSSYIFDENKINIEYFQWFLKSESFLKLISEQVKGGIKTEIKSKHILPIEISLPNLEIQQDIVEKLNQRLSRINIIALKNTYRSGNITSLRQQILQDAITGKLSEKWRKENPNIESAEVLLEKIKTEKEKLVKEGKIRKQKPLPPIAVNEIPFELPEGWAWCNGNLASDYIDPQPSHRTPVESTDGIPYVAMSNINEDGTINFSSCRKVSKGILDEHQRRYQIKNGDFVIGKIGTIGNPTILPLPQNYTLSANIVLIQPRADVALPLFLYYLLKSPFYISKMIESKSEMSYPVFGIKKMRLIIIPLPPLAEQQYIVERIESLFAKLDRIKELNIENQKNIDLLNQVILKEMFEDQL